MKKIAEKAFENNDHLTEVFITTDETVFPSKSLAVNHSVTNKLDFEKIEQFDRDLNSSPLDFISRESYEDQIKKFEQDKETFEVEKTNFKTERDEFLVNLQRSVTIEESLAQDKETIEAERKQLDVDITNYNDDQANLVLGLEDHAKSMIDLEAGQGELKTAQEKLKANQDKLKTDQAAFKQAQADAKKDK